MGLDGLNDVSELGKIDNKATDGLNGVNNSLAYRVHEIERHLHSYGREFGAAAVPSGETHVADSINDNPSAFQVDAGNDDWGAWVQILGSSDTPAITGSANYDIHRMLVTATERNAVYHVQIGFGDSGEAALSAGDYTEISFIPASNQADNSPILIQDRRKSVGTKAWIRTLCPGQDTATFDFYVGLHEYEG